MENEFQDNRYESRISSGKSTSPAIRALWGALLGIGASGLCMLVPVIRLPGILLTFLPLLAGFIAFGIGDKALQAFFHLRQEFIRKDDGVHAYVNKIHH